MLNVKRLACTLSALLLLCACGPNAVETAGEAALAPEPIVLTLTGDDYTLMGRPGEIACLMAATLTGDTYPINVGGKTKNVSMQKAAVSAQGYAQADQATLEEAANSLTCKAYRAAPPSGNVRVIVTEPTEVDATEFTAPSVGQNGIETPKVPKQ